MECHAALSAGHGMAIAFLSSQHYDYLHKSCTSLGPPAFHLPAGLYSMVGQSMVGCWEREEHFFRGAATGKVPMPL